MTLFSCFEYYVGAIAASRPGIMDNMSDPITISPLELAQRSWRIIYGNVVSDQVAFSFEGHKTKNTEVDRTSQGHGSQK